MFIQTEITPNPATLKFLPGRDVMGEGTANFTEVEQASHSPLALRLFALEGIAERAGDVDELLARRAFAQHESMAQQHRVGRHRERHANARLALLVDGDERLFVGGRRVADRLGPGTAGHVVEREVDVHEAAPLRTGVPALVKT